MLLDGWVENERVPEHVVLDTAHAVAVFRQGLEQLPGLREPHIERLVSDVLDYLHDPDEVEQYIQDMQERNALRLLGHLDLEAVVRLNALLRELALALHAELRRAGAWDDTGVLWLMFDRLLGNEVVLRRITRAETCQLRDVPNYGLPQ